MSVFGMWEEAGNSIENPHRKPQTQNDFPLMNYYSFTMHSKCQHHSYTTVAVAPLSLHQLWWCHHSLIGDKEI